MKGFHDEELQLPPWIEDASQIWTQMHDAIKSPLPFKISINVRIPPGSAISGGIRWVPEEKVYELFIQRVRMPSSNFLPAAMTQLDVQPSKSDPNQVTGQQVVVARVEDEQSDVEKIQKTSAIILRIQTSLRTGLKILDTIFSEGSRKSKSMEKKQKTPKKTQELTHLNDELEKIRNLKKHLLEVLRKMDSELLEFSTQNNPLFAWSAWNDLAEERQAIEQLLGQLSSLSIRRHLEQSLSRSKQEILADIVGLQPELARDILEESDHETDEEQIHHYFEVFDANCLQDQRDLPVDQYLFRLGFTEQRAKLIAEKIGPNPEQHITTLDYAHIFVQNLFRYDLLLTDKLSSLPDRSRTDGTVYTTAAYANRSPKRQIQSSNFQESEELEDELNKFFDTDSADSDTNASDEDQSYEYWFHGTDAASANKIAIEKGINISAGKGARDFSNGDGFYLSDSFHRALDWTRKKWFACEYTAILRYKVTRDVLSNEDGLRLSFPEDRDLWKQVIRYFRSEGEEGTEDLDDQLNNATFIIGPLSKDGWWDENKANSNWPEPLRDNWTQLCIRDKKLALTFNLALDKIAFVKDGKRHQRAMVPVC